MDNTQETLTDICEELRSGEYAPLADRIEAARKREDGNAAALREALANLVDVIDRYDSGSPLWWHCGAKGVKPLKDAKAALSAPPRVMANLERLASHGRRLQRCQNGRA